MVEAQYLKSALNVTRLALQARKARNADAAGLVMLLPLAELDMQWKQLGEPRGALPAPSEIRALL